MCQKKILGNKLIVNEELEGLIDFNEHCTAMERNANCPDVPKFIEESILVKNNGPMEMEVAQNNFTRTTP